MRLFIVMAFRPVVMIISWPPGPTKRTRLMGALGVSSARRFSIPIFCKKRCDEGDMPPAHGFMRGKSDLSARIKS